MANSLVVVVTGSNRGVGKGIVELLAKQQALSRPLTIYATSRSGVSTNVQASSPNVVHYSKLDITDRSSIESFFESAFIKHPAVHILINNAAVANDYRETPEYAVQTVRNNYGGTRDMCAAFLAQPNLEPGSRIVNLTSGYNKLDTYGSNLQERFRASTAMSDIDALAESYLDAVQRGQDAQQQAGWGPGARSYKVSKALINTLTIVLAQQYPDIMVNCCCPGWTDTDMGNQARGTPPKTPGEGARIPVRLAIGNLGSQGDEDGGVGQQTERVSGRFFENDIITDRGWGKAKLWLDL